MNAIVYGCCCLGIGICFSILLVFISRSIANPLKNLAGLQTESRMAIWMFWWMPARKMVQVADAIART
jgi:hypothetical protein